MLKPYSILNNVLGPVMHGPSSSHTAGSHRIGLLARDLLGTEPQKAVLTFDPQGSYAQTYDQQGSDLAFAAGLMGWPVIDERFFEALEIAAATGLRMEFRKAELPGEDHPNAVLMELTGDDGREMTLLGRSIGGGAPLICRVRGWPVRITGETYQVLVEAEIEAAGEVLDLIGGTSTTELNRLECHGRALVQSDLSDPPPTDIIEALEADSRVDWFGLTEPVFFVRKNDPPAQSAADLSNLAREKGLSLGGVGLRYEAELLGLSQAEVADEMWSRYLIMAEAGRLALEEPSKMGPMKLLTPTAHQVFRAEAEGRLPIGGLHTRAAARAMGVMHVNGAMGLVCAAPTGGAAGALPGVLISLAQDLGHDQETIVRAAMAASAIGLVVLFRGDTFAAEVAGCQVEIGAAGAMAAAAVVEAAGGTADQALDAAAISFQNTAGSVCDLVQGAVEIPCHTRNAIAASSAFVCADLILGGYRNPIPLDETLDASIEAGLAIIPEFRCTARGGLAITPSGKRLKSLR